MSAKLNGASVDSALYQAVINCSHVITDECVILRYDPRKPGHNALNQLARRLDDEFGKRLSEGQSEIERLTYAASDAMRERDDYKHAFEVEKAANEEALSADRAVERALGRAEGAEYAEQLREAVSGVLTEYDDGFPADRASFMCDDIRAALAKNNHGANNEQTTEAHHQLAQSDEEARREGLATRPKALVSEAPRAAQTIAEAALTERSPTYAERNTGFISVPVEAAALAWSVFKDRRDDLSAAVASRDAERAQADLDVLKAAGFDQHLPTLAEVREAWREETTRTERGPQEPHLWPGPLVCRYCRQPISGEGVTEDAGESWAHLECRKLRCNARAR